MSDWQRVQDIFLSVADLPAGERKLAEICGGDAELIAEVESLLRADGGSALTIDSAIQGVASVVIGTPVLIGERIGVYRVIREIGRGGMGAVYLAVRDDEEYTREVALKVVRQGMNTAEAMQRFRDERQILANLDHPYIARLFDGGTTADGVPFFAMEFVVGRPVDVFCRENSLSPRACCALFLQILEAVTYAHRSLVIHGDLKPANIFVTPEGSPKLLDFGVAKLVGRDASADGNSAEVRAFTPGYASPEQVRGLAVTTSADVYSLGIVLYELLAGERAQPVDYGTPTGIERAVCDAEVQRPALTTRKLPADLADVVLMAMCKEPALRYQSAVQFADDIRRCLEGRPVRARHNSVGYRVRKFAMRNRLQVVMASMLFAALLGSLVLSMTNTRRAQADRAVADSQRQIALRESSEAEAARAAEAAQRGRADQQRNVADQQRNVADQQRALALTERDEARDAKALADQRLKDILKLADSTLFDVHDAIAALPGSIPARRLIVQTTLDYLKTLENNLGSDDEMRLALAASYFKVAMLQGDPRSASGQDAAAAEKSLRTGIEILRPTLQRQPNNGSVLLRWIELNAGLSQVIYRVGRTHEATDLYLALIPIAHRVSHMPDCPVVCQSQEAVVENDTASEMMSVDLKEALVHAQRGIELSTELVARHPDDADMNQELATVLAVSAATYRNLGDLNQASDLFKRSIEIREALLRKDPKNTFILRNLLVACGNYATLLGIPWSQNLARFGEARDYAARSVAIARDFVKADPADATARRDLAMSLGRLGMIDPVPGGEAASLAQLQEAETLMEPISAANPKAGQLADQLAEMRHYQAVRLVQLGRLPEAISMYRKTLAALDPLVNTPKNFVTIEYIACQEGLAIAYATDGQREKAVTLANEAIVRATNVLVEWPGSEMREGELGAAYAALARVHSLNGSASLARPPAEKAIEIWHTIHTPGILTAFRWQMANVQEVIAASH